jgi:hypothetical protein
MDERRDRAASLARGLVDLVRDRLAVMTFETAQGPAVAAAALARAVALSDAARLLEDTGYQDCAGVMVRCALEAHDLGVYALFGGDAAQAALIADYKKNADRVLDNMRTHAPAFFEDGADHGIGEGLSRRLTQAELNRRANECLEAAGEPPDVAQAWYDVVSRFYSTFAVHGLGSVTPYLDIDEQPTRVRIRGRAAGPEFVLTAIAVAHLALLLFDQTARRRDDMHLTFVLLKGLLEQVDSE